MVYGVFPKGTRVVAILVDADGQGVQYHTRSVAFTMVQTGMARPTSRLAKGLAMIALFPWVHACAPTLTVPNAVAPGPHSLVGAVAASPRS
jgi:hypothetical protein